jgi:hypothetical protein
METARFWGIPRHRLATTTSSLSYRVLCGGVHYSQFEGALNQSIVRDGLDLRDPGDQLQHIDLMNVDTLKTLRE